MIALRFIQKIVALMACLSVLAGCGSGKPRTFAVTLPVTVNGQSPVGANVTLHPQSAEWASQYPHRPFGKVAADGTVRFSTFEKNDGVPAGEYIVSLNWPLDDGDALDGEHQSPERTNPLTLTVKQSGTLPELAIQSQSLIRNR